jgi:hypothetical protein
MRLLELKSSGECSLTKDLIENVPPYAILSHTWGGDDEEVTFHDFTQGVGKSKTGYRKQYICCSSYQIKQLVFSGITMNSKKQKHLREASSLAEQMRDT